MVQKRANGSFGGWSKVLKEVCELGFAFQEVWQACWTYDGRDGRAHNDCRDKKKREMAEDSPTHLPQVDPRWSMNGLTTLMSRSESSLTIDDS